MASPKRNPLVLICTTLVAAALTCTACGRATPAVPTQTATPTEIPSPTSTPDPLAGLVGSWLYPDNTIFTVVAANGGYAVTSASNPFLSGVTLKSTEWSNGLLRWTFCYRVDYCNDVRMESLKGDVLDVGWSTTPTTGGYYLLQRMTDGKGTAQAREHNLEGIWRDPDTTGTYHMIAWQGNQYVVLKTGNPNRDAKNELTLSTWADGVLTWTYCVPNGYCVTSKSLSVQGNTLYTYWTNDNGSAGYTRMKLITLSPDGGAEPMPGLTGKWKDPLSDFTYHTIAWLDGQYMVTETTDVLRHDNEVTSSDWRDGVLIWDYCPVGKVCTTMKTVSLNGDALETTWSEQGGNSGTKTLTRITSEAARAPEAMPGLEGEYMDWTDLTVTHYIMWDGEKYTVVEIKNTLGEKYEVNSSTWKNGLLTWSYCIPEKACYTVSTNKIIAGNIYIKWTDDKGHSGDGIMIGEY